MPLKTIDAPTLKLWLEQDEAILIDVREPGEHASGHITGAHLVPLSRFDAGNLPDTGSRSLVIHCLKGGRGQSACQALLAVRPDIDVYNLEGGISAWEAAGFPITRSKTRRVLSLDRQTQLTIGVCVLTGALLAITVHPGFAWVPAFFGAGLIFAGLTGFCGLARLLSLMPWNRRA